MRKKKLLMLMFSFVLCLSTIFGCKYLIGDTYCYTPTLEPNYIGVLDRCVSGTRTSNGNTTYTWEFRFSLLDDYSNIDLTSYTAVPYNFDSSCSYDGNVNLSYSSLMQNYSCTFSYSSYTAYSGVYYYKNLGLKLTYNDSTYYVVPAYIEALDIGFKSGYNSSGGGSGSYDQGKTDGINEVKENPNDYGLFTDVDVATSKNVGYSNGKSDGIDYVTSNPNKYGLYSDTQYSSYGNLKYSEGYNTGFNDSENGKSTFKSLMFSIMDAPFNVLSNAFDFEIFGINLSSFLISIVSLLLIFFVIRKLM